MASYSRFAQYYDMLTQNVHYSQRAAFFDKLVKKFHGRKGILLDLGCGTGSLSEEMARLGYDVIGVDRSQEMLSVALGKKGESGLDIQYLSQDMTALDLYGTVDVTLCALDTLNHLSSLDQVKKTFERVSLFTNPGGLFFFDVNTPYKHQYVLGQNTYVYDTGNVYCVWQNSFLESDCQVLIHLDFFEKSQNVYYRSEESFSEYAYSIGQLESLLRETGFKLLGEFDGDTLAHPREQSERIVFAVEKVS